MNNDIRYEDILAMVKMWAAKSSLLTTASEESELARTIARLFDVEITD